MRLALFALVAPLQEGENLSAKQSLSGVRRKGERRAVHRGVALGATAADGGGGFCPGDLAPQSPMIRAGASKTMAPLENFSRTPSWEVGVCSRCICTGMIWFIGAAAAETLRLLLHVLQL